MDEGGLVLSMLKLQAEMGTSGWVRGPETGQEVKEAGGSIRESGEMMVRGSDRMGKGR